MHTIKGSARTYRFLHLSNLVHEAEEEYDKLQKIVEQKWSQKDLLQQLKQLEMLIDEYDLINRQKLGRTPDRRAGSDKYLVIKKERIYRLLTALSAMENSSIKEPKKLISKTQSFLRLLGTEPVSIILAGVVGSLPSLAEELSKEAPNVIIKDNNIQIKNQMGDLIKNSFLHIIRNSLDHGIEKQNDRLESSKPPAGLIFIDLRLNSEMVTFRYHDDGRGLNLSKLRELAFEKGFISNPESFDMGIISKEIF